MAPRRISRLKALGVALAPLLLLTFAAQAAVPHHKHPARHIHHAARAANPDNTVTYNKDSPDPNISWHTDSFGMRSCIQDCDNPEIPGSGFTCKDVKVFGMAMRECDN